MTKIIISRRRIKITCANPLRLITFLRYSISPMPPGFVMATILVKHLLIQNPRLRFVNIFGIVASIIINIQNHSLANLRRNAYIERFNGSFRRDILDAYLFESLEEVKLQLMSGHDYNYNRPHDALNGRSPADMLAVDLWKTRDEFPTNPQPVTTMAMNKISNLKLS